MSGFDGDFDSAGGGQKIKARLKWFNSTKGFGFVSPVDGSADAFLHVSVLHRANLQQLGEQAEMICEVTHGPKGPQVINIVEILSEGQPSSEGQFNRLSQGRIDGYHDPSIAKALASGQEQEMSGTVKWFKADKGFGFVTADDSDKDIFVHKSVLQRSGITMLETGQRVQMRVHEVEKGREATWVSVGK